MARRHVITDDRCATWAGIATFLGGCYLLYDAYDRRGRAQPWPVRIVSWW